jgi:hypothetical protein
MKQITKNELLNEVMGVPRIIDTWVLIFTEQIVEMTKEIIERDEWTDHTDKNDFKVFASEKLSTKMDSVEFVKKYFNETDETDLLENEEYLKLPIWRPTINVRLASVDNVGVVRDAQSGGFSGGMGFIKNGKSLEGKLSNVGGQGVLQNLYITIEVVVDMGSDNLNGIKMPIKSTLSHELTHIFQSYRGLLNGVAGFGDEEILNTMINQVKGQPLPKDVSNFFHLVYAHLSFENNARVAQTYHELKNKGVNTKESFLKELRKTNMWVEYEELKNFNADDFIENADMNLPKTGDMFLDMLATVQNNISGVSDEDKLKKLTREWNDLLLTIINHYEEEFGRDISMKEVPKKALEDPYHFFKFWEKRFHKNAEDYRRKLMRVASLLVKKDKKI